jgi:hypothetical protein
VDVKWFGDGSSVQPASRISMRMVTRRIGTGSVCGRLGLFPFLQRHRLAFGGVFDDADEHASEANIGVEIALFGLGNETLPIVFPE